MPKLASSCGAINRLIVSAFFFTVFLFAFSTARASVKSYKRGADGITFQLDKGLMKIKVCAADIIQVKYTMFDSFPAKASLVINNTWQAKPAYTVTEANGTIVITTSKLK